MSDQEDLRRELNFWDALTIGVGTMIGAGIFLLAGVALEATGPAAIFSYLAAGLVCVLTAASAAELATGMPTSGGAYFFVSRAFGPAIGSIAGVGTWLSLTVAISFYLFGLGEYLAYFVPLPPVGGAALGGIALTALNVWGAKESGRTQVAIVLTLVAILAVFVVGTFFHFEAGHFTPFFPFGTDPVFGTTALVFVSFLGFVKIAAVAEEIEDPARNLPRSLIGSVVLVTILYVTIVLVIAGVFPQERIGEVRDPLTAAARVVFGPLGAAGIIFAGLLATASSANASIMASSRINLAMARDRLVPQWLAAIHRNLMTPHRAILVTGLLAVALLAIRSIEDLAKIASSLQLLIYAGLNLACIVLRGARPEWYRPSYHVPGSPWTQLAAAGGCLVIIAYSGPYAKLAVGVLVAASLAWYAGWSRGRVQMRDARSQFAAHWKHFGVRCLFLPPRRAEEVAAAPERLVLPQGHATNPDDPRRLVVALAAPEHEPDLLQMGRYIATGREEGGEVYGVHLIEVPLHTPISVARQLPTEEPFVGTGLRAAIEEAAEEGRERHGEIAASDSRRPLARTRVEAVTDYAHDPFDALVRETEARGADMLLMGWEGELDLAHPFEHPVQQVMGDVRADLAVLRDRGLLDLDSILVPWGGGLHARLGLEVALRVARATGAEVELLRVVPPDAEAVEEEATLLDMVETLAGEAPDVSVHIRSGEDVVDGILARQEAAGHGLVVIGASAESRLRRVLFGSVPDRIADRASCSVLMVRRWLPGHWTVRASDAVRRLRERLGRHATLEEVLGGDARAG